MRKVTYLIKKNRDEADVKIEQMRKESRDMLTKSMENLTSIVAKAKNENSRP